MKENQKPYNQPKVWQIISDIVSAGLEGDTNRVEVAALTLSRTLKRENPDISALISDTVSNYATNGGEVIRKLSKPLPVDTDSQLEMASVHHPGADTTPEPVINSHIKRRIQNFLDEREGMSLLLSEGIKPPNSLLLIGPPGTGKTMMAQYIASTLNKSLVTLDLSASISSLLGKTGSNIKKVLNYAKSTSSVLLLDEFDAIAKKRDDTTDLGEIKRVVNVLLMELENWPVASVLIATSNHPELLDRAIWRRFDLVIEIGVPEEIERTESLKFQLGTFLPDNKASIETLQLLAEVLNGKSAADLCKLAISIKRRIILKKEDFVHAALTELFPYINDKKLRGKLIAITKDRLGEAITFRDLSEITGLSLAGIQHHISKTKQK